MATTNPMIAQGTLNRVRTSVVIPGNTALNVSASNMGKQMARTTVEGNISDLIATATGGVESDEPYVFVTVSISLLRTQALGQAWVNQMLATGGIGSVTLYSDTAMLDALNLNSTVIQSVDFGAWDGTDPVTRVTLRGIWNVNNNLWSAA